MSKIFELNAHQPSVESVINILHRNQEKVSSITCIISYEDGGVDIAHESKPIKDLCYESVLLHNYTGSLMYDE